ncbi:xylulokinase [soil metagenome]
MPLVAGVDSSTQSTTVEIRDAASGELVARASAPHPSTTPPVSEQDPAVWWAAFEQAWHASGHRKVAAISVAAQQHGAVVLDSDREVLRQALLWNDTRSAPDAGWLRSQLDGGDAAWADAVGSVPVAAFTVAKLSWLHRTEPHVWERLAHVVLPHDWLTTRLTGELTTDRGDASGTGYWSPAAGEYRHDVLAVIDRERDWTSVVPRVAAPDEVVGSWNGVAVAPGTGDNMGAALGLALAPGDAGISIGTSGTVFTRSSSATADRSGAVAGFADATGGYLPLVCTLNGAKVLDAVRRLLGVDHAEFDRLALAGSSDGLVLLPYFDGERVPDRPDASGVLSGLRSDVTREQLARAGVEGVACGLLDGLDALRDHAPVHGDVVLTGGSARSSAVRAVVAGLCDRPVVLGATDESVATGACVQATSVLEQETSDAISARWALSSRTDVEPVEIDAAAVRERYAEVSANAT